MLYDILKGRYDSLKLSNYCNFNTSCTRAHPLTLVPLQSSINSYRHSFFVNIVFLWNTLSCNVFDLSSSKFHQAVYKLLYLIYMCMCSFLVFVAVFSLYLSPPFLVLYLLGKHPCTGSAFWCHPVFFDKSDN